MAHLPESVKAEFVNLPLYRRGKVRDTYLLPDHPGLLLSVASDRISIFDFVLPATIAQKGEILTAMNVFWRTQVIGDIVPNDLVTYGSGIDSYLPVHLRNNPELQKRASVVCKLTMLPIEAIVRGYLTGSGLESYQKTRMVCGHMLPGDLFDGAKLPYAIFTPTTKEEEGHDEHIGADAVGKKYGMAVERISLQLYQSAFGFAKARGIVLADTKFEFGMYGSVITLADELLTPDSSRFWDYDAWCNAAAVYASPSSLDKQFVREEGRRLGIKDLDPRRAEDRARVHSFEIESDICMQTTRIYRHIFSRLIGMKLEMFQRYVMNIDVQIPMTRIEIVLGSKSDLDQTEAGRKFLSKQSKANAHLNIISCHRNPEILRNFIASLPDDCVVIAAAGKAAALPGIVRSWLEHFGIGNIPVLGVGLEGDSDASDYAARLSIEELPGRSVILDGGQAYFGEKGFLNACMHAVNNEYLCASGQVREAQIDIPLLA
ncbi:MAG: phosphoribosylaminoimidazolesuccinocarboxamide synthase [bacterium]|nr:phosphoribosylaminoimidazolesuccinocarboxamide synthase [bacterium]MDZ4286097.1 phosphoribosylaminoimidazolesuccinocarboxamide synthase [Candidatus Sungbacteria bacterium]